MTDTDVTLVVDGDELSTLLSTLDRIRRTFDMIEEYARHTGHADLLREAVDGLVGEDAPA